MNEISESKLDEMMDKQALTELVYDYCRAVDRVDQEFLASLYHRDAFDDHGIFGSGPVQNFLSVTAQHQQQPFGIVHHNITNVRLHVAGDYAEGESYVQAFHVIDSPDGPFDMIFIGRYLDKFERRDGLWKFKHRRPVLDMCYRFAKSGMTLEDPLTSGFYVGHNGPRDPSYAFFSLFKRGACT
jgi:SnoaL-like domain